MAPEPDTDPAASPSPYGRAPSSPTGPEHHGAGETTTALALFTAIIFPAPVSIACLVHPVLGLLVPSWIAWVIADQWTSGRRRAVAILSFTAGWIVLMFAYFVYMAFTWDVG